MISEYYVNHNGAAVFVKEAAFFKEQGGLKQTWGKHWRKVQASSIEHARLVGEKLFAKEKK